MAKKPTLLIALLILAGGMLLYLNRDWFQRRPIQISHRFHAFGGRFDTGGVAPLLFEFDRKVKLTSIKVVAICDAATNQFPHALWSMVSDSNSVPTRGFLYGMDVPGMRRVINSATAEPLDPEQKYRLLVEAGSLKGQHDFDLDPTSH